MKLQACVACGRTAAYFSFVRWSYYCRGHLDPKPKTYRSILRDFSYGKPGQRGFSRKVQIENGEEFVFYQLWAQDKNGSAIVYYVRFELHTIDGTRQDMNRHYAARELLKCRRAFRGLLMI